MRVHCLCASAIVLVSPAFGFVHHVARLSFAPRLRGEGRACYGRRVSQLALSGEALAVGAGEVTYGVWGV